MHPTPNRLRALAAGSALLLTVALAGCTSAATDTEPGTSATARSTAAATATESLADHDDASLYTWDAADEVAVTLDGTSATVDGDGATVDGGTVTITAAGTYRLTGTLTDGQVVVETADDGVVRLVLDDADVTSTTGAALSVTDADVVVLILEDATTSSLTDGEGYVDADAATDAPNAAVYSTADLTIGGTGSLTVTGRTEDGITSTDGLVVSGGTITVDAIDDGIRGKDYLVVRGESDVTVTAGGDALKADAEAADDAAAGYVAVEAGTVTLAAGDDGVHAEGALTISGGTVDVTTSTEGLEALQVTISGGVVGVRSSDDGVNVSGGTGTADATAQGGGRAPGGGGPGGEAVLEDGWVLISGGTTTIDADGDGFDSNGSATMTGGTLIVYGPTMDGNGAIDVNGTFTVDGGTLIAAGSAGMAQAPSDSSGQAFLGISFGTTVAAGSEVVVTAADGTEVVTVTPAKAAATLVVSMPGIAAGESYDVSVDGTVLGTVTTS